MADPEDARVPEFDYDVFLSHNRADKDWVRTLAARIEAESWQGRRLRVFFDEWDLRPGQSIPRQLEEALPKSRKVLVVLSPEAVASAWVELERFVALSSDPAGRQGRLIPLLRRDCEIPALLSLIKHLDFRQDSEFEHAFRQLLSLLRDEPLPRGEKAPRRPARRPAHAGLVPPLSDERDAVITGNPFYCAGMIQPPFRFVGRKRELRLIEERAGQGLSSTAIVGERRLGKSSLLYEAARRLNQASLPAHRYRAVYLDCQHGGCQTAADFVTSAVHALLTDLALSKSESGSRLLEIRRAVTAGESPDLHSFGEALAALRKQHVRPLLLLDEFEKLASNPDEFDGDFFDELRAFANRGDLGIVTATKTPLRELFPRDRPVSNFPNLFVSRKLGDLTADDAAELVSLPSAHHSEEEQQLALRIAGLHPLRLEVVCGEIYSSKEEGVPITEPTLRMRYEEVLASWGDEVRS